MKVLSIFLGLGLVLCAPGAALAEKILDAKTKKALEVLVAGVKSGNGKQTIEGEKMLESLANAGNGNAAFNLSAYYHFDLPGKPPDKEKECYWVLKAAKLGTPEAYSGAFVCSANKGRDKVDSFVNYQVPWARKMASEGNESDRAMAQEILTAYENAKREDAARSRTSIASILDRLNSLAKDR